MSFLALRLHVCDSGSSGKLQVRQVLDLIPFIPFVASSVGDGSEGGFDDSEYSSNDKEGERQIEDDTQRQCHSHDGWAVEAREDSDATSESTRVVAPTIASTIATD